MQSRLRSHSKLIAEINMVPFTDVVLVLLVIFMFTTPFLFQERFPGEIAESRCALAATAPETITFFTVTQGDKIYLNDKETTLDLLTAQLEDLMRLKPQALVMINADKNVSHGSVADVMSKAYLAGVTKVGIAVELDGGNATTTAPTTAK